MFRILNVSTNLFSKGGARPSWSKCGKVWTSAGGLTAHLSQMSDDFLKKQPWEIQEFDFSSGTISNIWTVMDYLNSRPSRAIRHKVKAENNVDDVFMSTVDMGKLHRFTLSARGLCNTASLLPKEEAFF